MSLGGVVFGIAQTAVNPPAAAARVPVAMSSLYSCPGSRRWVCRSMRPGMTHCPRTSITRTLEPTPAAIPGPTCGDDAVLQQNVRLGVKTPPRIEDPAAAQTEIHLPGPLVRGLARLSQPVSPPSLGRLTAGDPFDEEPAAA